jgi:beta-xylosidase
MKKEEIFDVLINAGIDDLVEIAMSEGLGPKSKYDEYLGITSYPEGWKEQIDQYLNALSNKLLILFSEERKRNEI